MESDKVRSILQNVAIILSTRQGSVPMYRDFGLPMNFVDKPFNVAQPLIISEIVEAIQNYEPRAKVVNVRFIAERGSPDRLVPVVEVEIDEGV